MLFKTQPYRSLVSILSCSVLLDIVGLFPCSKMCPGINRVTGIHSVWAWLWHSDSLRDLIEPPRPLLHVDSKERRIEPRIVLFVLRSSVQYIPLSRKQAADLLCWRCQRCGPCVISDQRTEQSDGGIYSHKHHSVPPSRPCAAALEFEQLTQSPPSDF